MSTFARRLSCLLCLFSILAGATWARPGRSEQSGDSALSMLEQSPLESALAIGWNTRSQFDTNETLRRVREGSEGAGRALKDIDNGLGMPVETVFSCLHGSGYLAIAAGPNGRLRGCLALRLDDEAPIKGWLKLRGQPAIAQSDLEARGLPTLWTFGDELYAVVQDGWLVLGSDELWTNKPLLKGHRILAQEPMLGVALRRVPADRGSVVAFSHGERMRAILNNVLGMGYLFPNDELAFWDYAVASVDMARSQTDGFLSIPENGTAIRKALVSSGGFQGSVLTELPAASLLAGLNVVWLHRSLEALVQDSSDMAWIKDELLGDLNAYGKFNVAFPGSAGLATDAIEAVVTGPPSAMLAAKVGDAVTADRFISAVAESKKRYATTACASNLKNIGTAMEMWSTDNSGKYPTSLATLTPNYLWVIPSCPVAGEDTYSASLQTGPNAEGNDQHYPDYYIVKCGGKHHDELQADHPQYNGIVGLTMGELSDPPTAKGSDPLKSAKEKRDYKIKDALVNLDGERGLLRVAVGPKASTWFSETGEKKLPARVQDATKWAGADLLGLVYLDYRPGLKVALAGLRSISRDELELMASVLEDLAGQDPVMEDVHALRTTSEGLLYRGQGLSSSRTLGASGLVAVAILYPNFVRARSQGQLTACKSNLKNIATAMEMWSTDNAGKYPTSLEALTPNYLRSIPVCPAAGRDSYSASLQTGPDAEGNTEHYQDYYYFKCQGHNHPGVAEEDYPQYNAYQGLIERPNY